MEPPSEATTTSASRVFTRTRYCVLVWGVLVWGCIVIENAFQLFAPYLDAHGGVESWATWKAVLKAIYGESITTQELEVWRRVTDLDVPHPEGYARSFWAIGRSSGKTTAAAIVAAAEALHAARGDRRADVLLVAQDARRSAALLDVVRDLLDLSPFAGEVERESSTELRIGRARVRGLPSSSASIRGFHGPVVILDELAHLRGAEGRFNDHELLKAAVPAVRPFDGRVIGLSSPRGESGLLWEKKARRDPGELFVHGPTWRFNPGITEDQARRDAGDDQDLMAEYEGRFISNLRALLDEDTIEGMVGDYQSIPPNESRLHHCFVDMSGARHDSAVLGVAFAEKEHVTVALLDEVRAPFNAQEVVRRFAARIKDYGCHMATGDLYAGDVYIQEFARENIRLEKSPLDKSGLYVSFAAAARSGRVTVPRSEVLARQLRWLEEKILPTGTKIRESGPNDDVANSCAGAVHVALSRGDRRGHCSWDFMTGEIVDGTDFDGNLWRDRQPWTGTFVSKDSKGRVLSTLVLVEGVELGPRPEPPRAPCDVARPCPTVRVRRREFGDEVIVNADVYNDDPGAYELVEGEEPPPPPTTTPRKEVACDAHVNWTPECASCCEVSR